MSAPLNELPAPQQTSKAQNVLQKIVADKEIEVAHLKQTRPLESFRNEITQNELSFYDALAADGSSYIFECKKASPSKGLIRENFDLDEICQAYSKEAACFSVLTDEKYFQGKHEYLQTVKSKVSQPCLNKDFFVDEYQIHLARFLGAQAVLLMLSVLSDEQYTALSTLTHQYNMDVLTEVSNEEETERALALGANIIGINNRNLRDLSTDLATTEMLAPLIRKDSRFKGVIISESGIYTNHDIQRLSPLVDGFLVGSALMAQDDLNAAVSQLVYGKVKVCGVSSVEQAALIAQFPVSYMGLIFAHFSKRHVSLATAIDIVTQHKHQYVGVFVNASIEQVLDHADQLNLAAVQLHGSEDISYINALRQRLNDKIKIFKAVSVDAHNPTSFNADIDSYNDLLEANTLDYLLLDTKVNDQSGGTGQSFNWQVFEDSPIKHKLILAGGLNADNVLKASQTKVAMLDVNSGAEIGPAQKSKSKLQAIFAAIRS